MMLRHEEWLYFGREDLQMAELAFQSGIYNQVCFHSQQCLEKGLKALLAYQERNIPRTHSLSELVTHLEPNPLDNQQEIQLMDRFYIPTRYPDALPGSLPDGLPNKEDAREALLVAQEGLAVIVGFIDDSTRQSEEESD